MSWGVSVIVSEKETEVSPTELKNPDWEVKQLQEIAEIIDSCHKTPRYSTQGMAMVRASDVKEGYLNLEGALKVTREIYDEFTRNHIPQRNDIVMSRVGTYFVTSFVKTEQPFCLGQNTVIIHPQTTAKFLYYMLISPIVKRQVEQQLVGSGGQETLSLRNIRELKIPYPPLPEREVMERTLSPIDDKIELNWQVNKTLEAIGQAIFKHWFVDFEFPNEEGKPYKSSGGELVYNEVLDQEIPSGWHVKSIDEIADFLNGLALQRFPARDGEEYLPVIKIRELRQGITESSDKANLDLPTEYIVNDGDILFSWSGSLEVTIWGFGKGALNQHLFKVTSPKYPKWFFYYWILRYLPEYRQIAAGKATTMGHIQRHNLTASKVTVPDDKTLERMDRVFAPILKRVSMLKVETRILSEIRDALLPKLVSGKIRVPVPKENLETQ
jgi:type I restriction enzyme S subunit